MRFKNREEAGRLLAQRLQPYRGQHPLVLGVPRGGMPIARVIADELGGDMDVVLVRKLRSPRHLDQTLGAVDEQGNVYTFSDRVRFTVEELARELHERTEQIRRQRWRYSSVAAPIPIRGRIVIVVDDGVATGSTLVSAIRAIRGHRPRRVVAAVPISAAEALRTIKAHADEVICLHTPRLFRSIEHGYDHFEEVTDETVMGLLRAPATLQGRGQSDVTGLR
jgi:predicted phosphoribosyltransferase